MLGVTKGRLEKRDRHCPLLFSALIFGGAIVSGMAHASDASFQDFPIVVACEVSGVERAYYLSKIDTKGVAFYLSPDRLAGTITISGTAKKIGGDKLGSCAKKTLDELRAAGQAFDLKR